jgi:hypothetical protein
MVEYGEVSEERPFGYISSPMSKQGWVLKVMMPSLYCEAWGQGERSGSSMKVTLKTDLRGWWSSALSVVTVYKSHLICRNLFESKLIQCQDWIWGEGVLGSAIDLTC